MDRSTRSRCHGSFGFQTWWEVVENTPVKQEVNCVSSLWLCLFGKTHCFHWKNNFLKLKPRLKVAPEASPQSSFGKGPGKKPCSGLIAPNTYIYIPHLDHFVMGTNPHLATVLGQQLDDGFRRPCSPCGHARTDGAGATANLYHLRSSEISQNVAGEHEHDIFPSDKCWNLQLSVGISGS